jgi:hypothetical protein
VYDLSEPIVVVDDLHGSSTEHVTRTHEHGVPDLRSDRDSLVGRDRGVAEWLGDPELLAKRAPALAILCEVDRLGARTKHHVRAEPVSELERCLTAEAHDDSGHPPAVARRCRLCFQDVLHVL